MDDKHILQFVCEILREAKRPLLAREIARQLGARGIEISKTELNQLLWNPKRNPLKELQCDQKTFLWSLDTSVPAAKQEPPDFRPPEEEKVAVNSGYQPPAQSASKSGENSERVGGTQAPENSSAHQTESPGSRSVSETPNDRVERLFRYLERLFSLDLTITRKLSEHQAESPSFVLPITSEISNQWIRFGSFSDPDDAWLTVVRPNIRPAPSIPEELRNWVKPSEHPDNEPEPKLLPEGPIKSLREEPELSRKFEQWMASEWHPWAIEVRPAFSALRLYSKLFSLNEELSLRGSAFELLWGTGNLYWSTNQGEIEYPLVLTGLELLFDEKKVTFELRPRDRGHELHLFPILSGVEGIDNKIEALEQKRRNCQVQVTDPRNPEEIREYVASLARLLHPQGDLAGANPSPNAVPMVSTEQTIFLRPVSQHLWVQDFREIINSIEHQGTIPLFIESLVADAKEKRAASESLGASESSGTRETVEALFPLPVNDEQLSILDAVETAAGVVVQGPPGTGKSHTIANLISHYLAQGARILVTSHSEKALSVLRNKLPEAIRQLSVSVLTSDSDSKRELQDSVRTIHSKLGSPNTRDKLEYLQNEVRVLKERRRQTYHALIDTEERENTAVTFGNFSGTPLELSKRITASKERDGWLKDVPNRELVFQLNDDQLKRLFKFLDVENVDFVDSLLLSTPDGSLLLSPDEFRDLVKEEGFCEEALKESNGSSLGGRQDDLPSLERLHQLVANHVRGFRLFETEWIKKIAQEIKRDGASLPVWRDFLKKLKAEVEHLLAHDRKRLGANVESSVPSDADLNTAISAFEALATKAPPKSKISFFSKLTLPKSAKAILSGAKVHGKMVNAFDELQYLIADLSVKRCLLNIEQYHAFLAKRCGTPKPKAINELDLINEYSELIADLEFLLVTSHTSADSIKALSSSLRINLPAGFFDDEGRVRGLEKIIRLKIAEGKLASIRDKFLASKTYLGKFDGQFHVHGSVRRLIEALDSRDPEAWASEIVALNLHKESSRHTSEVLPILKYLWELFPLTLNWIRNECSTETRSRLLSERWNDAISFHRAESFIGTVLAAPSPQRLRDDLVALERQIENARGALIAAMAWFRQLGRITPSEREALKAWDQAVTDLGKGTGRKDYVERKRRAVRDAMRRAVSAVPVWIMPLHRVVESFHPPEPGLFELVIVDESSQCDLRALSVLYRGKKVIVVGDDKQVSPENTGVDRSKVNSLIQQFLHDIPFKERFSIDDSLYNVASLRLPQTIMLREHFRCVPEIIEFSNHNFYKNPAVRDSGLVPMRLPLPEERIPEPLKAVFVPGQRENNVNLVEAQAIAEKLAELIKDPQYEKKTFGVITLIANPAQSEAIQKLVHASIPQSEIRARKIQIGDPKWFQGDERDVVLLSMVVGGPDDSFAAQTKASDQRRFNVAASRARDQMWLFHSVRSSEIQNPECLRLKLLTFFAKSTVEVPVSPSGRPLNEFETAVAKMILARGYEVLPQFPAPGSGVMRYIDLVVQGSSSRLAIECDGDRWHGRSQWEADQRRENQLRRAGWTFWRVRGTEFYRNPEEALLPLWDKLAEMGIHPSKAKTLVS